MQITENIRAKLLKQRHLLWSWQWCQQ